jgi:hypothetical protein
MLALTGPNILGDCFCLGERHANPVFLAPDDVAMPLDIAGHEVQRDLVWNAHRARNALMPLLDICQQLPALAPAYLPKAIAAAAVTQLSGLRQAWHRHSVRRIPSWLCQAMPCYSPYFQEGPAALRRKGSRMLRFACFRGPNWFLRHFCHSQPQFEIVAPARFTKSRPGSYLGRCDFLGDQMRDGRCRQFGLKTEFAGTVTA